MNSNDKQKLTFDALDTEDLLAGNFVFSVPRYQRGYSWQEEHVQQILDDLHKSYSSRPNDTYLLGQIITCPSKTQQGKETTWDLIDGQQRMTTLFLILLAGLRRVTEEQVAELGPRKRNMYKKTTAGMFWFDEDAEDEGDREIERPRVIPASDGLTYFYKLIQDTGLPRSDSSPTQSNIREAWETICDYFDNPENFPSPGEIWAFVDYLLHQVRVINLQLENVNQALEVFIRVNDRGLELDNADLLKGLLFQRVTSERDFESLSKSWAKATKILYNSKLVRLTSMEFLLRLLIAIEYGEGVRTSELFDKWETVLTTAEAAKSFGEELPRRAQSLQRISEKKSPLDDDSENRDITYQSSLLRMIQHYELLLAGDHLSPSSFATVLQLAEERAVLSTLSGEPKQDFERHVHSWAKIVSQLDRDADAGIIKDALRPMLSNLDDLYLSLPTQLSKLNYLTGTHKTRIRYVLARTCRLIQMAVDSQVLSIEVYMQTSRRNGAERGYDLDHIFPQADEARGSWQRRVPSPEKPAAEDDVMVERSIQSIGNLTLLHPRDNNRQSTALPWDREKVENFEDSGLWANRMLSPEKLRLPNAANQDKFAEWTALYSPNLESWGSDQIEARTIFLAKILEESFRAVLSNP